MKTLIAQVTGFGSYGVAAEEREYVYDLERVPVGLRKSGKPGVSFGDVIFERDGVDALIAALIEAKKGLE